MIETRSAEVWCHTECGWVWFKREGKTPKRCPNPKCRKLSAVDPASLSSLLDRVAHVSSQESVAAKRKRAIAAVESVLTPAKAEAEFLAISATYEEPDVSNPSCPDCGAEMAFNRIMKRLECECGYRGKKAR